MLINLLDHLNYHKFEIKKYLTLVNSTLMQDKCLEMKPTKAVNRPLYRMTESLYACGREALIYGDCVVLGCKI